MCAEKNMNDVTVFGLYFGLFDFMGMNHSVKQFQVEDGTEYLIHSSCIRRNGRKNRKLGKCGVFFLACKTNVLFSVRAHE